MKRILLISVVLAMLCALLIPTAALAAKPKAFEATGVFNAIDEGTVTMTGMDPVYGVPIYDVQNRHIWGEFERSVKGETNRLNGPFTITYNATVNGYQIGTFTGILKAKSATFAVEGISYGISGFDPANPFGELRVDMGGTWTGIKGIKAEGNFVAYFCFIPAFDENGVPHVGSLTDSSFVMTGTFDK